MGEVPLYSVPLRQCGLGYPQSITSASGLGNFVASVIKFVGNPPFNT